jgi:hypothetical protein
MTFMRIAFAIVLSAIALTAPGCGGGDGDFSGEPTMPDGYKQFSGNGVTFAYPGDWEVRDDPDAKGGPFVQILPPDQSKTPYGIVQLSVTPGAGDRFDSLADQRRVILRDVNEGKIESDDAVEIEGAEKALRAVVTTPPGQGNDPVEVKADSLDVLRSNGDLVVLTAAAPQRGKPDLDPSAVVESFRLAGS